MLTCETHDDKTFNIDTFIALSIMYPNVLETLVRVRADVYHYFSCIVA